MSKLIRVMLSVELEDCTTKEDIDDFCQELEDNANLVGALSVSSNWTETNA